MIIIDPVTLGDLAFSRASPKWAFNSAGSLIQVPANVPAVTYDPADLSKAPYVLIEPAATNLARYADTMGPLPWGVNGGTFTSGIPDLAGGTSGSEWVLPVTGNGRYCRWSELGVGTKWTFSAHLQYVSGARYMYLGFEEAYQYATFDLISGVVISQTNGAVGTIKPVGNGYFRVSVTCTTVTALTTVILYSSTLNGNEAITLRAYGAQLEAGVKMTSYIAHNTAGTATRAADVIGGTAGLLYSNVAEAEPLWSAGTYAQHALVRDATHVVWESLVDGNSDPLPTETSAKWGRVGASAPWAMFDQYNNTQTTKADEIIVVVSARAIARGAFLGNLDATEVRISVVDPAEGLVYREEKSLVSPSLISSFYSWAFGRIKRSNYFFTTKMLPYADALVTIAVRRPGGVAKCGMCAIGPVDEFGPSLMGLSTEGKDYSTTTFDSDGMSSTKIRPYAKRMSVDVLIDNTDIDYVHTRLEELRQRPVAWVGGKYGSTAVFGRYGSFRNVIESFPRSKMALQIEGTV